MPNCETNLDIVVEEMYLMYKHLINIINRSLYLLQLKGSMSNLYSETFWKPHHRTLVPVKLGMPQLTKTVFSNVGEFALFFINLSNINNFET